MLRFETPHKIGNIESIILNGYLNNNHNFYVVNIVNYNNIQPKIISIQNFVLTLHGIEFYYNINNTININLSIQLQIYLANTVFTRIDETTLLMKSSSGNIIMKTMDKNEMDLLINSIQNESQSLTL